MYDVKSVILELATAREGSRELDVKVGQLMGWRRRVEQFADEHGAMKDRTLWLVPSNGEAGRVPRYTTDLQCAYQLALDIAPGNIGGCAWEPGKASARVELDAKAVEAATPALALCMAALKLHPRALG